MEVGRLFGIREQSGKEDDQPCHSVSDFISPSLDGKSNDFVGMFSCTGGIGVEEYCRKLEKENLDDYASIMVKVGREGYGRWRDEVTLQALADRLAEATAEWLHREVRVNLWGYSKDEVSLEEKRECDTKRVEVQ